jgi:hypothetical protein
VIKNVLGIGKKKETDGIDRRKVRYRPMDAPIYD